MSFFYDLHSLVTITSDTALPELAAFSRPAGDANPTLRVRVGPWLKPQTAVAAPDLVSYREAFGRLGFAVQITLGGTIDVAVAPLLRRSPHVLYTNVVEPILRWTFVRKGWALVHGACFACGADAYLITAPTDTGKTTPLQDWKTTCGKHKITLSRDGGVEETFTVTLIRGQPFRKVFQLNSE